MLSLSWVMRRDSARGPLKAVGEVWPGDKCSRGGNDIERFGVTEHRGTL